MGRRIELCAGVAAALLGVLAVMLVLFAPLVPYCGSVAATACVSVRNASLFQFGIAMSGRVYLLVMLLLVLMGALGALAEAWGQRAGGGTALYGAAPLAFCVSVYTTAGPGLLFLPAVLALVLAAYVSLRLRFYRYGRPQARWLARMSVNQQAQRP